MAWSKSTRITVMLAIDIGFFILELAVGLIVGSLALLADAFHMLNDIISLLIGLWAVKAAQKTASDKYSFGYLRAEILGAFFNAVFLIALCVSIVLEAITRLIDPPKIENPKLILVVGCMGLASNLVGFFVLGGHGHSHGPGDGHDHGHSHGNQARDAEEGHAHGHTHAHTHGQDSAADETNGRVGDVLPEALVSNATKPPPTPDRKIQFTNRDEDESTMYESGTRVGSRDGTPKKHRRRSSGRAPRFTSIDDLSIHPARFRDDIIAASRPQLDGIESATESEDESAVPDDEHDHTETSPLIGNNGHSYGSNSHSHDHHHGHNKRHSRGDSVHASHNHNKPRKEAKSHGHNHDDMGMRAMVLHVIGDALGNVGVIAAALIIWLTHSPARFYADPCVSLFITLIILRSTIPLTSATAKILLQATPDHLDVKDIKEDIQNIPSVVSCHHVHIWQLSDSQVVCSMHIEVSFPISSEGGQERYMQLAKRARKCLHAYGIHSATIQPEFSTDGSVRSSSPNGLNGMDGMNESCLLECVDDCQGKGCCSTSKQVDAGGHDHHHGDGHDHEHSH